MLFRLISYRECSTENMHELGAVVCVLTGVSDIHSRKLREVSRQSFLYGRVGQHFEKVARNRIVGSFGKPQPVASTDNGEYSFGSLFAKEELQAHVEDHCDTSQGRQSRNQLTVLQLRKH